MISDAFAVFFDEEPGYAWSARQSRQWLRKFCCYHFLKPSMVKKILLLSLSLSILGVVDHEVIAASLPNSESVEFLES